MMALVPNQSVRPIHLLLICMTAMEMGGMVTLIHTDTVTGITQMEGGLMSGEIVSDGFCLDDGVTELLLIDLAI